MTRILLRMPNWVGDCVMATPAIALLREAMPGAQLHALCRPSVAGVLAGNPHLDTVIAANEKALPPDTREKIRNAKYDAVALFTNSLGSAWMAFRWGITRRIGFNRDGRAILLTTRIPFDPFEWQTPTRKPLSRRSLKGSPRPGLPFPMVEYYNRIARATMQALGASMPQTGAARRLLLPVTTESEARIAELIRVNGLENKTLIGVNPGAAHGPAKRFPADRLGKAINLLQGPNVAFVSTAAPSENHLNDALQAETPVRIHRLGESTKLVNLAALISRLAVLITNDSGAMHIAAARQVPTVAIFGPTDWASTQPWMAPFELVHYPVSCSPCFLESCPITHPCMKGISPEAVAEAAKRLLAQRPEEASQ